MLKKLFYSLLLLTDPDGLTTAYRLIKIDVTKVTPKGNPFSFRLALIGCLLLQKVSMSKISSKTNTKSSTTSIKLSETLKKHSATAAKELGMTTHAFMVEAIKRATEQQSMRHSFIRDAIESRKSTIKTGKVIQLEDAFERLRSQTASKKTLKVKHG